jgi:uncharacterized RmlC-like cupin family protein
MTIEHVRPSDRVEADATPGMVREQAIAVDWLWAGVVRTAPGSASGWHHHGEHETSIYVEEGTLRMEFGVDGGEVIEAKAGDFLRVPKHLVHREINDGAAESRLVVVRAGTVGPTTINVDGPSKVDPEGRS